MSSITISPSSSSFSLTSSRPDFMSATHPPNFPSHKSFKPSLYEGCQRKYNHLHQFQTGGTTIWSGYMNFTGKPFINSNPRTSLRSKNSTYVRTKPTT